MTPSKNNLSRWFLVMSGFDESFRLTENHYTTALLFD